MNTHRQIRVLMALICVLVIQTCDQPDPKTQDHLAGDFASATLIREYSPAEISLILQSVGVNAPGSGSNGIRATKIKYYSLDHNQDIIELSGAIIYPLDNSRHPLLSIQHGTVTERTAVASVDPMNSSAGMSGLLTGALGYVTLIPDFAGYGDSHAMHPYMHAESLANSVIDFIRAARVYCDDNNILLNEKLFLTGYSEGGYATLAAQRKMEMDLSDEFSLTAIAPMAGAYDLEGVAKRIFEADSYTYPTYIAYLFVAYSEIYDLGDLSRCVQPSV